MHNDPFLFFRYVFAAVFVTTLLAGAFLMKNHRKLFGSDEVMPSENSSARSYTKVMVYTVWAHAVVLSGAFALFLE